MKILYLGAAAIAAFVTTGAAAQTVYNTSLQNLNGAYGTSTATTTTNATGTRTVVSGPGPNSDANRAHGIPVVNQWYQDNVGAGTTVGITTDLPVTATARLYSSKRRPKPARAT